MQTIKTSSEVIDLGHKLYINHILICCLFDYFCQKSVKIRYIYLGQEVI